MVDVEFIKYTGEYPVLCMGNLVVKINGKQYVFGDKWNNDGDINIKSEYKLPPFWESSGTIITTEEYDMFPVVGDWAFTNSFKLENYPEEIRNEEIFDKLMELMNEKVEHGCCGGCI